MDFFEEQLVARKKGSKEKTQAILVVLACIVLTAGGAFGALFIHEFLRMLVFLVIAAAWCFGILWIRRQNVEYEYTFTNGELDVDIIYARSKRKNLITVRAIDISFCARMDDVRFEKKSEDFSQHLRVVYAASNTQLSKVYYADFYFNAEKTRLLFEPNKRILEMLKKYNPKNIHLPEEEM